LPPLVRKQRRLEAQIVSLAQVVKDEKALRQEIDALLIAAEIAPGDLVTCIGYDVRHKTRAGSSSLNEDVLTEQLVAAGVARELIEAVILASTETGDPAFWAEVKPSKGAAVRVPRPAKAALPATRKRAS